MHFTTRNAIAWQRNAINRTRRQLARARTDAEKDALRRDIRRFNDNIATLEAANG